MNKNQDILNFSCSDFTQKLKSVKRRTRVRVRVRLVLLSLLIGMSQ